MSEINLASVAINLGSTAITVLLMMAGTLGISLLRRRHDTIDTVWGFGFAGIAVVSFVLSGSLAEYGSTVVRVLVTALTVIWGVRLAVHLHLRNSRRGEDPRYERIIARAKGNPIPHMIRKVYLPQGVIMWLVSLPVQFAQYGGDGLNVLGYLGVLVWLLGFGFETIGDAQLARFRANNVNSSAVLDTGLWRYTRHPNYFGDACAWWGLYLLACNSWLGVATVISPLLMTFLLVKGTGKPLLERSMARTRPEYAAYVERTSGFFPLPPKSSPKQAQQK